MIKAAHINFLTQFAHANQVKHSGRTLLAHLRGTHDLLREWRNKAAVCEAGLFHSIYGTNKFKHVSWPRENREMIKRLIGEEAENLVFTFCSCDRPGAFFDPNCPWPIGGPALRALREIEAANLIDQGSRTKWLERLRDSDISDAAKFHIKWYLGQPVPMPPPAFQLEKAS